MWCVRQTNPHNSPRNHNSPQNRAYSLLVGQHNVSRINDFQLFMNWHRPMFAEVGSRMPNHSGTSVADNRVASFRTFLVAISACEKGSTFP